MTAMPAVAELWWRAFRLSKKGNAVEDYEDACAAEPAAGRFAVADGASEASFAAAWARVLVEGFVAAPGKPWLRPDWFPPLRRRWAEQVDGLELPWYAEAKREQGAFATLLGVAFQPARPGKDGQWRAVAVGDTCLFHTRGGRFLASFPLEESAAFGNRPRLLGSRQDRDRPEPDWERAHGRWRPGDRFLLMTDALAEWFLRLNEKGARPLEAIDRLLAEKGPEPAFPTWVEERRDREDLRNDDVTLVVIEVVNDEPAP
jgi:hypothetical protein